MVLILYKICSKNILKKVSLNSYLLDEREPRPPRPPERVIRQRFRIFLGASIFLWACFFWVRLSFLERVYFRSEERSGLVLLIGRAGLLRKFSRLTFFGHFYQILALFTAPRVILDLIMAISIEFWVIIELF
jgi:hypothetical protein